jgi:transposase
VEVRERAVRLVLEHQGEHRSQRAAITSIVTKCGMTPETLRKWVRRAEVDAGGGPSLTSDERKRLAELERENREPRRRSFRAAGLAAHLGEIDGPKSVRSASGVNASPAWPVPYIA